MSQKLSLIQSTRSVQGALTADSGSCHAIIPGNKLGLGVPRGIAISTDKFDRYLSAAIDVNVISDRREAYAYAKLQRLLLFGFLQAPIDRRYRASRIGLRTGVLGPGAYQLPTGYLPL
jgi:hypothetical protein